MGTKKIIFSFQSASLIATPDLCVSLHSNSNLCKAVYHLQKNEHTY